MKKRILVIDDEQTIRMSLKEGLKDLGYQVAAAKTGREGLRMAGEKRPHAVLLDLRLTDGSGLDLISPLKEIDSSMEVVMMTAHGDIPTAVKAIRNGAWDYIHKPFDLDEVSLILGHLFSSIKMKRKLYMLEQNQKSEQEKILSDHSSMQEVFEKIAILARNDDVTVLISGETGTGKELVASAIHQDSQRRDAALLKINCAAIPAQLMESELFGYEKNAFTGAGERKKGLLELADGGTVFLDEVGELTLDLQAKILRVLEEQKFRRVGGLEDIEVDLRIVTATNKNLEKAVENREFREDLYYRLNVVPINLPPLRERGKDVLLIARHFVNLYNQKFNKQVEILDKEVEERFLVYDWKGNIRELRNVLERMIILKPDHEKTLSLQDLPQEIRETKHRRIAGDEEDGMEAAILKGFSLEDHLKVIERKYLLKALELHDHNHTKAAEALGISRFALKRKLEKAEE